MTNIAHPWRAVRAVLREANAVEVRKTLKASSTAPTARLCQFLKAVVIAFLCVFVAIFSSKSGAGQNRGWKPVFVQDLDSDLRTFQPKKERLPPHSSFRATFYCLIVRTV